MWEGDWLNNVTFYPHSETKGGGKLGEGSIYSSTKDQWQKKKKKTHQNISSVHTINQKNIMCV